MIDRSVVVITGASSGIGAEIALAYAAKGYAVVLAARREDKLQVVAERCRAETGEDLALVVPTDVTQRAQVESLAAATMERFGRIDVWVNNAGYGQFGRVHELEEQDVRDIFEVNFFGAFHGCRVVAPIMIEQRRGHIFNISSVIGKVGSPFHGAYSATKFALSGLTEAMRVELRPFGVHVTDVCPALTETAFFDHVRDGEVRQRSDYLSRSKKMHAHKVARRIVRRTGKYTPTMIFTAGGRLLVLLGTVWPRLADRLLKVYHDDLRRASVDSDDG